MTQKKQFEINKKTGYILSIFMIIIGAGLLYQSGDRFWDDVSSSFQFSKQKDKSLIRIWLPLEGVQHSFYSEDRLPGNLLLQAGINFYPGDELYWNGSKIAVDQSLPEKSSYLLQYQPQFEVTINQSGKDTIMFSNAVTLGAALWEGGFHIKKGDNLSNYVHELLIEPVNVVYAAAYPVTVHKGDSEIQLGTSSASVGQALADAGMPIQALDFCIPDEGEVLPEDGVIRLEQVSEVVVVEDVTVDFEYEHQPDPEENSGQEWVIEPGEKGAKIIMQRIRYVGSDEPFVRTEFEWIYREAKKQIVGYGTKAVMGASASGINPDVSSDGIDVGVDYWAVKPLYATSYYPCGFKSGCSYITASGATLQKGVVAVTTEWYSVLKGTQVYVPGYGIGVIADSGGGIPGTDWIDLGYGNDDYVQWSETVNVYFLNPAPAEIPWFLK